MIDLPTLLSIPDLNIFLPSDRSPRHMPISKEEEAELQDLAVADRSRYLGFMFLTKGKSTHRIVHFVRTQP